MKSKKMLARYAQGGMVDEVGQLRAAEGGMATKAKSMLRAMDPKKDYRRFRDALKVKLAEGGPTTEQKTAAILNAIKQNPDFTRQDIENALKTTGFTMGDVETALASKDAGFLSQAARQAILNPIFGSTRTTAPKAGESALGESKGAFNALNDLIQNAVKTNPNATREDVLRAMVATGANEEDLRRAGYRLADFPTAPPAPKVEVKETIPEPTQVSVQPNITQAQYEQMAKPVTLQPLDTAFRESSPRTAQFDRFGRVSGYNYGQAASLKPATGTNVFNWTPPTITSRPRSLLNLADVPGVTVDPVTGQTRMPLSASQQFARDRSELDRQVRSMYAKAAAADTSLPSQMPYGAAAAFRQFAMTDPVTAAQLRMRDIEQAPPTTDPQALAARAQYGQNPYLQSLQAAFDPFLANIKPQLITQAQAQKSYFERNPDVAAEFANPSTNFMKEMKERYPTPDAFSAFHYYQQGGQDQPWRGPLSMFSSPYQMLGFKDGGEATTEDFLKKQSGGDVSRGTSEVPQLDAEGRLIDENAEMRSESQRMLNRLKTAQQESYRRGKLPPGIQRAVTDVASEERPPLVRGKAVQTAGDVIGGLVSATPREPTNPSEAYRLMQGFTGAYLPTAPVVRTAQAAKMAAQEPRATMSAARQSLEALGDIPVALAQPNQLGSQAGAVRPYGKGTVFSGVKLANDRYVGSSLDDYIDQGKSAAFRTSDVVKADAIQKFFDTKARRYMSTQLGTERDPVFDAIKKGRISNLALHDIQGLRKYAIEAAGEGKYKVNKETGENVLDQYGRAIFYPKDPQAVMDVTKAYDEMVDVKPMSFKPGLIPQTYKTSDPAYMQEAERIREQMLQAFEAEGLDPRLVNLKSDPMILTSARDTGEPYYPGYLYRMDDFIKDKLSGDPEAMKGVPENIRRALDQGELLYDVGLKRGPLEDILDPESMANYLATLSPKEIDKIRFEDAVVRSAKFNQERIDRKFEGLRLQELVKSGKAPDKVFSKGVSKPLLQFGEDQRHPGFAWKRLEDLEATIPEGAYVGHSVGGYALGGTGYGPSFTKGFQEGTHEIYSLRDARNRPVTTIQVIDYGDESSPFRVVKQIKGNGAKTGNTAPVDYDVEVYDFLTQVVKPDAIAESDSYLTPMLIQYRDALEANRQTR